MMITAIVTATGGGFLRAQKKTKWKQRHLSGINLKNSFRRAFPTRLVFSIDKFSGPAPSPAEARHIIFVRDPPLREYIHVRERPLNLIGNFRNG
jgi:hypothetical protein